MKARTTRRLRQIHLYIGMFFAPMILLFALSGALQTFRLNEPRGWGGTPPTWMVWVGAIHKNQSAPRDNARHDDRHDDHQDARPKPARPPQVAPSPLPLKILTVLMAVGLFASTVIGMVIALNLRAYRTGSWVALALGTVLPIVLLRL
ncbi:hypothetical protein [Sphingomonas sp. GC_Shp_3]|uniref:hypothetical protein n=1 Tax=Sphingomonas sp. GC_Shp_3 TaxID=2937383 RepID=UPI00226A94FA|nr:hypothetical protein [Sphingomonas sp. GC_Shp_3]